MPCGLGWLFLLTGIDAEHTRLVERSRTTLTMNHATVVGRLLATRLSTLLVLAPGDFVMARRQMLGIKRRAERDWYRPASRRIGLLVGPPATPAVPSTPARAPISFSTLPRQIGHGCLVGDLGARASRATAAEAHRRAGRPPFFRLRRTDQ